MNERFLDDFSSSIKYTCEQVQKAADTDEAIFIIIQNIAGYFANNVYIFIFSLFNFHDRNQSGDSIPEHIGAFEANITIIQQIIEKKYNIDPSIQRLIFTTLTFFISDFHRINDSVKNPPSGEQIRKIISKIFEIVKNGLSFPAEEAGAPDFEKLEKQVEDVIHNTKAEPLFKTIAEAVAQAGPWNTSMEAVANRIGLSKSSLYCHFKSKKDMMYRLFITEFMRIIEFARNGISFSENTAEQLYLGIYSISVYLKLHSEILVAMDWIRTRKFDLGKLEKKIDIFRLFEDIKIESLQNETDERRQMISHWILFLLISILMQSYWRRKEHIPVAHSENSGNSDIRQLYKFVTLGLGGFKK
jgi:AcrR family transcriptional regulator